MKTFILLMLLTFIIGNIGAVDTGSHQFIEHIREITAPVAPHVFEDAVLFTASSSYSRVGISFAHEGYARVHWFRFLRLPRDATEFIDARGRIRKDVEQTVDSGVMFHLEAIPVNLNNLDYRLVIDGLWLADPVNPITVSGPSGLVESRVPLPPKPRHLIPPEPGTFRFFYRAPAGENISVGGSFNNWDPFMYQLQETEPGIYTLSLPLPPGTFQYVFFHRGEWIPDPVNERRRFSADGRFVSEASVP
jgi:hypothetical protein